MIRRQCARSVECFVKSQYHLVKPVRRFSVVTSTDVADNVRSATVSVDNADNGVHNTVDEWKDPVVTQLLKRFDRAEKLASIENKDWRLLIKHLEKLRADKNYSQVIKVGETVLSKGPEVARMVYEELFYTLDEFHPTIEYAELAMDLMESYIEQGHLKHNNCFDVLRRLYRIISQFGDNPFLNYRYRQFVQAAPLSSGAKVKDTIYSNQLLLHVACGELEGAVSILKKAADHYYLLSKHVNEIAILALAESGDMDYAYELMQRLYRVESIFSRTWGIFVQNAAKHYHYDALRWTFKTAIIPGNVILDDWTYAKMAEIGSQYGDFEMVRWVLMRSKRRHETMTNETHAAKAKFYLPLVEALAKMGRIEQSFEFLEKMQSSAEMIELHQLSLLVEALSTKEHLQVAAELMSDVCQKKTTSDSYKTLFLNIVCQASGKLDPEVALQFYRGVLSGFDVRPNEDSILLFLRCIPSIDPLLVDELHDQCEQFSITLSKRILESTVVALRRSGYQEAASLHLLKMDSLGMKVPKYIAA